MGVPSDDGHHLDGRNRLPDVARVSRLPSEGLEMAFLLIIFAGIVARLPTAVAQTFELYKVGQISFILLVALALLMLVRGRGDCLFGKWASKSAGSVCEAGHRSAGVRGTEHSYPTEDQYGGGDPSYFCLVHYRVSCDYCRIFETPWVKAFGAATRAWFAVYIP